MNGPNDQSRSAQSMEVCIVHNKNIPSSGFCTVSSSTSWADINMSAPLFDFPDISWPCSAVRPCLFQPSNSSISHLNPPNCAHVRGYLVQGSFPKPAPVIQKQKVRSKPRKIHEHDGRSFPRGLRNIDKVTRTNQGRSKDVRSQSSEPHLILKRRSNVPQETVVAHVGNQVGTASRP